MSLSKVREVLANSIRDEGFTLKYSQISSTEFSDHIPIQSLTALVSNLSGKEKVFFNILYRKKGEFISRMDLSKLIWEKDPNNSTLAQLSQIVGRVKRKMQSTGIDSSLIKTHWKKGYALHSSLYESIEMHKDDRTIQKLAVL